MDDRLVTEYIAAANAQDVDAAAACFVEDAVVVDEKQEWRGISAVRKWAEEASRKYRPVIEVLDVSQRAGKTVLTGRVSGDFPGSPVELHFRFVLRAGKIERLEIG